MGKATRTAAAGATAAVVAQAAAASRAAATANRARPRADAVRNRERILAAAREAFVTHGAEAPLDEIARRAGVGNATLYRHFPDRRTLLFHVLLYVNERLVQRARQALEAENDPFEALRRVILDTAEERVGGLCGLIGFGIDREHPELVASRQRMSEMYEELVARAHASGRLRPDVGAGDLLIAVSRLTLPVPGTGCPGGETMSRRHLQIFLDGLRTPVRSELPGRASRLEDLKEEFS
ncbi:TetR/AcrR family transcriptional regulator [Streptomyces sp. DSM 44917]|uniref:TetR/AcrR family transcriptional regulator n=1 Tax=Streptomyces boetiae TaxID=3075541 RepID=A0ABU2LCM7_9ACTN|nr:TetR/AcrR family transcriptional regulator [Streptomyces sp. DSM 44917]MDT0309332.1 TetR/AcrR family transcriptional regulator [Streptomyces sp. DSM 44917]